MGVTIRIHVYSTRPSPVYFGYLFAYTPADVVWCVNHRPEECLTVREALDLYTLGGAYGAMQEHRLGRLQPGFQADFVVLDKDVCTSPKDLLSASVLEVWVAGQRKL